jgi:membrane fusion protein (multidrug efflux system)
MRMLLPLLLLLSACGGPAAKPPAPPPPQVQVTVVGQAPIERVVRLLGQSDAVDGVTITAKVSGIVAEIAFASGSDVQAGQVLVRLDQAREEAEVREARGERDQIASELANRRPLVAQGLVSTDEIARIEAQLAAKEGALALAEAKLAERVILAPFAGRIGVRRVSVGALVAPGTVIAPLFRMDPLQAQCAVPEVHIARLKPGLVVRASSPAYPGRVFNGQVSAIDPGADPASRSVATIAVLPNPEGLLRPGMALTIDLVTERIADALVVPDTAVLRQGDQAWAWRVEGDPAVVRRAPITTGVREAGRVQVLTGLAAGDRIVMQGVQQLRDGIPVRVVDPAAAPTVEKARP